MRIEPAAAITGHIAVPGDKSLSHRAVLLAAVAEGETRITGFGRSEDTEATIEEKSAEYPQLEDTTFIYGNLEPDKGAGINIYTTEDNRPRFLSQIGMEQAPIVEESLEGDQFFLEWSPERADELESDVFVTWVPEATTKQQIEQDPLLGQIPAVRDGALVADPDETLTRAISAASPLSLPWALDEFLPQLAEAADHAG